MIARIAAACLLTVLALGGCRSRSSAPTPVAPSAPSASAVSVAMPQAEPTCPRPPAPRASDPTEPLLLHTPDRPTALHSRVLDGVEAIWDVSPFKQPTARHPQGTLLLAPRGIAERPSLVEIDVATLHVVRKKELPFKAGTLELAATPEGAIVAINEQTPNGAGSDLTFVLDDALEIRKTLRSQRPGTANVHASGALAAVIHDLGGRAELVTLELPSGQQLGRRELRGQFITESLPIPQLVVRNDRVFTLTHAGRHLVLRAYPADLNGFIAETREDAAFFGTAPPMRIHHDGQLVPAPEGVFLVRPDSTGHYDRDLKPVGFDNSPLSDFPNPPAYDPTTFRVLFASGEAATHLADKRTELIVAFRRGHYRWSPSGKVELRYDDPVAAFFIGQRGVIVTKHPGVRITVLEWDAPPPATRGIRMY